MARIIGSVNGWEGASLVVGVLRSYNNPDVVRTVDRASKAGIGKLFVVVNAAPDNGATRAWLKDAGHIESEWLEIIELQDYSWSKGLNAALRCIQNHNRYAEKKFEYILNFSVEALFEKYHISKMIDATQKYSNAGVVGVRFEAKRFVKDTENITLGRSYNHPRNTFALMAIEKLGAFWWSFDLECDQLGGMEDIEFVLRMLVYTGLDSVLLEDVVVPLIVGKHYNQQQKEEREQMAMDKIIAKHLNPLEKNSSAEAQSLRKKIEAVVKEMQLQ